MRMFKGFNIYRTFLLAAFVTKIAELHFFLLADSQTSNTRHRIW
jgi:hypothetical protein